MTLPMLSRKYLIMAKIEADYGSDPTPIPGTNAILVENLKFKPVPDVVERDNVALPDLSKLPHLVGKVWGEISFDVELRGSSDTDGDTPPDYGCLLRACSMEESISGGPGGSVGYTPISDSQESVTIYCNIDGQQQIFVGCMGDWKLMGEVGKPAKFSFTFKGKYSGSSDTALGSPVYQNYTPPLVLGASFSYGGWSPPVAKFAVNLNNTIAERNDIEETYGITGFFVSDRKPDGSIDPESQTLATRDIWGNLFSSNEAALSVAIGSTNGNKCTITADKCVKKTVDWGERNAISIYDIAFGMYRTSGNDEISLLFE